MQRICTITPMIVVSVAFTCRCPVKPIRLLKVGKRSRQKHHSTEAMARNWCSRLGSSRPPESRVVFSSQRCKKSACEWQEKSLLPNPAALIGSILGIISLHIPMRQVLCGRVASSCVILLGFLGWEYPRADISGEET